MAFDMGLFEAQRRAAQTSYGANASMNAYSRFLAEQGMGQQKDVLTKQYNRALPQLMSAYGKRNVAGPNVQSGIQRKGLGDFAQQKISDFGNLTQQWENANRQYDLQGTQLESILQQNLADLESEKARQIAEDARAILQSRAGGY